MTEPDPLRGSIAKVDRAGAHLNALHAEVGAVQDLDPKPYRFITKVDVEASKYIMRVLIERPLPIEWSLIVGDFLNNLRAALDHMVWEFVAANGNKPSGTNAFPIFDQPPPTDPDNGERKRWERSIAGISPDALALVESCQPYQGPDGPRLHLLHALRKLSNEDKHRVVLSSYGAVETPTGKKPLNLKLSGVRDIAAIKEGQIYTGRALKHGSLVLEAPLEITGPNPEVKADGEIPLDIGWGDPIVPLKGLRQMIESVAMVVTAGRELLGGDPFIDQFAAPPA